MDQMGVKASVFWPANASAMATVMLKFMYTIKLGTQILLYTFFANISIIFFRLFVEYISLIQ